jgi:protease-4
MKQGSLGCLLALVLFALVVSLVVNLVQFSAGMGGSESMAGMGSPARKKPKHSEVIQEAGATDQKVVQIDLEGIITSVGPEGLLGAALSTVESIKGQIEQAAADDRVKAVVLRINSPGGEVTASDTLYTAVKALAKTKPVVVYMDSIAASGGYYIACGATKVVASETTLTASIGVIIDTINYTGLFEKVGLQANTFVSGAFKDSLSGARPMRDDEKAYVQNLVGQMYERFLGIVSEARGVPKDVLRNGVADGRVVTGKEALEAKLVDQLGYLEDARKLAKELGKAEKASVVKYRHEMGFMDWFASASAGMGHSGEAVKVNVMPGVLPALRPGLPYYVAPMAIPTH